MKRTISSTVVGLVVTVPMLVSCGGADVAELETLEEPLGSWDWDSTDRTADHEWCFGTGYSLHVGDFDGDGQTDLLCHSKAANNIRIDYADLAGKFKGSDEFFSFSSCSGDGDRLYVGRFNSDARSDLVCVRASGERRMYYNYYPSRPFGSYYRYTTAWCNGPGDTTLIGDFNGGGRDDMLCLTGDGRRRIDFREDGFGDLDFNSDDYAGSNCDQDWCSASGSVAVVGRFNADDRDDLLCYVPSNDSIYIDHANNAGTFFGTNWHTHSASHPGTPIDCGSNPTVAVGDFDGDGFDDFMCQNYGPGDLRIALNDGDGHIHNDAGTPDRAMRWSETITRNWCQGAGPGSDTTVYVGDFNIDRDADGAALTNQRADLLCHDSHHGPKETRYAADDGFFRGVCNYDAVTGRETPSAPGPVGNGALGPIPVHIVVLANPHTADHPDCSPDCARWVPTPGVTRTHPLTGETVRDGEYFQAMVDVINWEFQGRDFDTCFGDDCLEFSLAGYTWYADAHAHAVGDCAGFRDYMEPDGSELSDAAIVNACDDPVLVDPRALNLYVFDKYSTKKGFADDGSFANANGWEHPRPYVFVDYTRHFYLPHPATETFEHYRDMHGRAEAHEIGHTLGLHDLRDHDDPPQSRIDPANSRNDAGRCWTTSAVDMYGNLMYQSSWNRRDDGLWDDAYFGDGNPSTEDCSDHEPQLFKVHHWAWRQQQHFFCGD